MDIKTPFKVVRGTENKIQTLEYQNGYVYFTTDTKKIYLDVNNNRLPMGGNVGIYYADVKFESSEDVEYFFTPDDIIDGLIPNVKDLILNTDGCFYKVEEISEQQEIKASKLTIAGTSYPGGPSGLGSIDLELIYPIKNTNTQILVGKPFELQFNFMAKDENGESTGSGRYEILINNVVKQSGVVTEGFNSIEIGKLFNIVGDYSVKLKCYGDIGGSEDSSKSRSFSVSANLFTIEWKHDDTNVYNLSDTFHTSWSISVPSTNKLSYVVIDDKHIFKLLENSLTLTPQELEELGIKHGTHKFELYAEAFIENSEIPVESEHIIKNIMFYDNISADDPGYIINCNFFKTQISQFDTITIPIMIYHPSNINGTATIQFRANGVDKGSKNNCKNLTYYNFSYTPDQGGFMSLQFICGTAEKSFVLDVAPLELEGLEEVKGYAFKFKATDFANNEAVQNWTFKDQDGITQSINFPTTFDWINGGLQTGIDDVGPYFKIQAGSYMEFPYKMFSRDLKDTGACFKIIFKDHNCRDYDSFVANCQTIETYEEEINKIDEETNLPVLDENENQIKETVIRHEPRGLALNAQSAQLKSLSNKLEVKYCEDSYIEYEFDVCQYSNNVIDQYLTVWLDGIPAGVTQMTNADSFWQNSGPISLRIGSEDCDVYLYLIKFYQKHLNSDEHLNNFIMDAPNATEMMKRFNRNHITIKDGQGNVYISPQLLAEKNPDCNVFMYEIPHIPTSKSDVHYGDGNVKCCNFTLLKGSKDAIRSYTGVALRAQGTSSMTYGISAYNLDAKFPEKWSINDTSIPVNYMNTKVNVASCEGANNALNQEWYNRYQPYKCKKRLQEREDGKIARDTMEFINGVVFIQDNNKTINSANPTSNNIFKEIPGYTDNPYPRMYSIGNMGNAKKNVEVFHGAGNQYECCIENADNNTSAQRMLIIGGYIPAHGKEGDPDYTEERDININLSDDMFDAQTGFLKPEFARLDADWGTTFDPQTNTYFDNKTLWKNALIGEGWFEFRYCIDKDDFKSTEEFSTYEEYQWELSNRYLRLVRWFAKNNPSLATNEPLPEAVTIPDYTVKGVQATTGYEYNEDDEVLKGTVVTGGTFTKDTAEYRIAKMLQESENYLILDSIIYHYLFIERHTMVDNVAKNTFWTTEDGIHWDLTKDYDNDTADGVNNSGNLVFDYGYEIMDNVNHMEDGDPVFNARPSAWLHFAHGLLPLRETMYSALEDRGAWKAQPYLELFENWQNKIPEICWIEDFNRKYFRPNNVYKDSDYLSRLASGKKTHQRKQFETYQEQYMNSEYKTNTGEGNLIQWRSRQPDTAIKNSEGNYEIKAKVKMYADGYLTMAIASGAGEEKAVNIHRRGRKGQELEFSKAQLTNFDDATCFLYSPNLYQEFTGIEGLYPDRFTASAANKLRKISIEPQDSVQETRLSVSLSLGPNIEEVIAKNCKAANFDLDLSLYPRLKKLDAIGSAFTSISIADGAPLNYFKVESPQTISMSNLRYLKLKNELEEETFKINSYAKLLKVIFDNIDHNDVNSKDIINNINRNNNIEYSLKNVKWNFNEGEITDTNIPILDYLLLKGKTIGVYEETDKDGNVIKLNTKRADSLTGTAIISNNAYNGTNTVALYEKYGLTSSDDSSYPKLDLNFVDENNMNKLYTIIIKNGDGEIRWRRKYANYSNISNIDLQNSSLGALNVLEAIKKKPSPTNTFTFKNQWKYSIIENDEVQSTGIIKGSDEAMAYLDLSQLRQLSGNIIIEPDYSVNVRQYTISFVDKNTDTIIHTTFAEYDTSFANVAPPIIPVMDDTDLALNKTYHLLGYSAARESNTLINQTYWKVTEDTILYPVFEEIDVYDIDYTPYLNIENNILKGLKKNNDGDYIYQGAKLVIPKTVISIGSYAFGSSNETAVQNKTNLKQIFIAKDSLLTTISAYAFAYSALEYFEFVDTITTIEQYAFRSCNLQAVNYNGLLALPESLIYIGHQAFNSSFGKKNQNKELIIQIHSNVETCGQYAIAHLETVKVDIYIGSALSPSKLALTNTNYRPIISSNNGETYDICNIYFYTNKYNAQSKIDNISIREFFDEREEGSSNGNITVSYINEL